MPVGTDKMRHWWHRSALYPISVTRLSSSRFQTAQNAKTIPLLRFYQTVISSSTVHILFVALPSSGELKIKCDKWIYNVYARNRSTGQRDIYWLQAESRNNGWNYKILSDDATATTVFVSLHRGQLAIETHFTTMTTPAKRRRFCCVPSCCRLF